MNISYNWLKEYVNFDLTPDEVAAALTSIGLETGGRRVGRSRDWRGADLRGTSQFRPFTHHNRKFG